MTSMRPVLPPSHILRDDKNGPQMWVQEAIFGHRFMEEQKPFMLVLEALAVCRARLATPDLPGGEPRPIFPGLPSDGTHEAIQVAVPKMAEMRLLLFRGQSLEVIEANAQLSDDEKLARLVTELNTDAGKLLGRPKAFDYLLARFRGRFPELAVAIRLLRGLEVDALNSRRWTSRFLVPRGPHLQISDLREDFTADRRFFGRGGEIAYLMLNRSPLAGPLGERIRASFLDVGDPLDHLARVLSPAEGEQGGGGDIGYLPCPNAPAYGRLAEDWLAILSLPRLPSAQKLDPLSRLTALSLVRYIAERSAEVVGADPDPMPLDLMDGARSDLRDLCRSHFERARAQVHDAVASHIRQVLEAREDWRNACSALGLANRSSLAKQAILDAFRAASWDAGAGLLEPDEWMERFIEAAKSRHRNGIAGIVKPTAEGGGFSTSRQKVGTWWRATDEFLEALVLANVAGTMTIEEFAARLHARYGLVIGSTEADLSFPTRGFDITSFEENFRSFERRLAGLGYVRRLSDDCAFVSNPFGAGATR